jgi:ferredoxin
MNEAEVVFENEGLEGIVPTGTYLADAAKRIGVREGVCEVSDIQAGEHKCAVEIKTGTEHLSKRTDAELELLPEDMRKNGHRLACFARVESGGEIVVMTQKKKEDAKPGEAVPTEEYKKTFAELPLEKKLYNLAELEVMALSETFSFVINSPYKVADKLMDILAEFGLKKEADEKQASRPAEKSEDKATNEKSRSKKKPSVAKPAEDMTE